MSANRVYYTPNSVRGSRNSTQGQPNSMRASLRSMLGSLNLMRRTVNSKRRRTPLTRQGASSLRSRGDLLPGRANRHHVRLNVTPSAVLRVDSSANQIAGSANRPKPLLCSPEPDRNSAPRSAKRAGLGRKLNLRRLTRFQRLPESGRETERLVARSWLLVASG